MKIRLRNSKKIKTLILFLCLSLSIAKAQYVTIPDSHFVTWLQVRFPTSMNGNQLDTTNIDVSSFLTLTIGSSSDSVSNLDGIQYLTGVTNLECQGFVNNIPALPRTLTGLNCGNNRLTSLPALPNSLTFLDCSYNQLTNLPFLNSLTYIDCSGNLMTSLPTLPASLTELHCINNVLTTVPALPSGLKVLSCVQGTITHLPALPNSITWLNLTQNQLTSLPTLPSSLVQLDCGSNQLTSLPALPNTLTSLGCDYNQLTSLPTLPYKLTSLNCADNNITCFAPFSDTITSLIILPNPITCLPNYIPAMDANTITYSLCATGNTNGCAAANSCAPIVIFNLNEDTLQQGLWYVNPFYSAQVINARWIWGDGTSTLGLYPSHTYTTAGAYNICVTAFASCGDSATYCQNDSIYRLAYNSTYNTMIQVDVMNGSPVVSGINKPTSATNQVSVYPNPSNGNISITSTNSIDNIKVTNMLGQTVYEAKPVSEKTTLQITNAGVYFVTTTIGNGVSTKKIIVNK